MTAQVAPLPERNAIVMNKRSLFTSLILIVNIVVMPLKAYVSEPLPWHDKSELWDYQHNCSISIDLCHRGWDTFFHEHKPLYGVAFGQNYDVMQENITISPGVRNFSDADEPHVTFAVFETPVEHHNMLQILSNQVPITNFSHFNVARFFGIPVSYSASWGELINDQPCIWVGFRTAEFSLAWQCFKFAARCLLTLYIARQIWCHYYCHYVPLIHNLIEIGLPRALPNTTYEIVVGDPTSVIILDPVVNIAFIIDFWLSADFVTRAFMRLTQTEAYYVYITACFYLSRTVWFAYGAMNVTSYVLKRLGKEKYFCDMDPTFLAVALSMAAGPLTSLQFRVTFLFSIYRFLFSFMLSDEKVNEGFEIAVVSFVYTFVLGSIPMMLGLFPKTAFKKKSTVAAFVAKKTTAYFGRTFFATPSYNDWKHRCLIWCIGRSLRAGTYEAIGGGIYELFAMNQKYKQNVCISQRGADCYVLFKKEKKTISVRLSLIQCVDLHHVAVVPSMNSAVGEVKSVALDLHTSGVALSLGSNGCSWIM